jgi:hypothetical protein
MFLNGTFEENDSKDAIREVRRLLNVDGQNENQPMC